MNGMKRYRPEDCGIANNISNVSQLQLLDTEKRTFFSTYNIWQELVSKKGNIGYLKKMSSYEFVSIFGQYDIENVKNKEHPYDVGETHVRLNGTTIVRGIPVRPGKWWQITNINWFDFNDRQYFFSYEYLKGHFREGYHILSDANKKPIMHIARMKPYSPLTFEFFIRPGMEVDEATHAFIFILLKRYYDYMASDTVVV